MKQTFDMTITQGNIRISGQTSWEGGDQEFAELEKMVDRIVESILRQPGGNELRPQMARQQTRIETLLSMATKAATTPRTMQSPLPMQIIIYCILNSPARGYDGTYGDRVSDHAFHFNVTIDGPQMNCVATCLTSPLVH